MATEIVHCHCPRCQQEGDHPDRALHAQMNLLMSRLDEAQRRWYAALEAQRYISSPYRRERSAA